MLVPGEGQTRNYEGHVKVNDRVVTKPSFDVAYSDSIEITEGMDRPAGYWKLKDIQEKTNLIKKGDRVLDIGSSAGGSLFCIRDRIACTWYRVQP